MAVVVSTRSTSIISPGAVAASNSSHETQCQKVLNSIKMKLSSFLFYFLESEVSRFKRLLAVHREDSRAYVNFNLRWDFRAPNFPPQKMLSRAINTIIIQRESREREVFGKHRKTWRIYDHHRRTRRANHHKSATPTAATLFLIFPFSAIDRPTNQK